MAIFGLFGALRRVEFYNLCVDDVKEEGSVFVVSIKDTKTHRPRTFTIINDDDHSLNYIDVIKNYMKLRPKHVKIQKFFLFYGSNKCSCNPIGINTFGQIPRNIAKYLKLPNADEFTGHSFRRTSATILADSGADIRTLKRHGDWKSDAVAEGYVADSRSNKNKIAKTLGSVTNRIETTINKEISVSTRENFFPPNSGISISGNHDCTITININK